MGYIVNTLLLFLLFYETEDIHDPSIINKTCSH